MRAHLITHLHCANCGSILEAVFPDDAAPPHKQLMPNEPTGALCYHQRVSVRPCKSCIEKAVGPARKLAQAISELGAINA